MPLPADHRSKLSSIGFLGLGVLTAVGSSGGLLWFVYKGIGILATAVGRMIG